MVNEDDARLKFVPIDAAVIPPADLICHIKDSWWMVHPIKGLVFYIGGSGKLWSPQCNRNKELAERFLRATYPWAEIMFIPSVFYKINPNDYVS